MYGGAYAFWQVAEHRPDERAPTDPLDANLTSYLSIGDGMDPPPRAEPTHPGAARAVQAAIDEILEYLDAHK